MSSRFRPIPERRSTRQIWILTRSRPLPRHHDHHAPLLLPLFFRAAPLLSSTFSYLFLSFLAVPFLSLFLPSSPLSPSFLYFSFHSAFFTFLSFFPSIAPLLLPLSSRYTSSASPFFSYTSLLPLRRILLPACQYAPFPLSRSQLRLLSPLINATPTADSFFSSSPVHRSSSLCLLIPRFRPIRSNEHGEALLLFLSVSLRC